MCKNCFLRLQQQNVCATFTPKGYVLHLKVIANYLAWNMVMGGYYHYFFMK